jgi:hypothetical protein
MGSLRPWTLAIVIVLAVSSLLLSSVYLLWFSSWAAPSTCTGKDLPVEASSTSIPFNTFETPGSGVAAGTMSTGGIGAATPTTRYAPTNMKSTLYPGELPGYTGWPRPTSTLAGFFRIVDDSSSSSTDTSLNSQLAVVGKNWTCSIHCSHKACQHGGSLFFVRAYGPAILPGQYTDHRNGTYDVTFLPLDAGLYTIEIVLTFSNPPAFFEFPVAVRREPAYEGYMLPGFPATVMVGDNNSRSSSSSGSYSGDPPLPLCTMSQMLESSPISAVESGRWLVQQKNVERINHYNHDRSSEKSNDDITLDGYAEGENALGVRTEHRLTKCSLLDVATVRDALRHCSQQISPKNTVALAKQTTRLRLIFIGDSNIGNQKRWAEKYAVLGDHFPYSIISVGGGPGGNGLNERLPLVKKDIEDILLKDQRQGPSIQYQYVVLFNAGLHDIMHLCGSLLWDQRINFAARGNARCADLYREKLTELVKLVQQIPSIFTVFQTTTAAWHKWGVFGNYWPPAKKQPMPFTTSFVEYFNEIAWDIMREMKVPIMDTYWLTLSRPDHREVNEINGIQNKMVHAGLEVYSVLVRKWSMMILEAACPGVVPHSEHH